jgi:hypothetical protein
MDKCLYYKYFMRERLQINVCSEIFKKKTDKRVCETLFYKDEGNKSASV